MFLGAEIRLDVGFNAAQARLANLARGGLLRRASHDAYDELGTGLARIGPLGAAPGMSRLVAVRFSDMAIHEDFAIEAMRWEAIGPGGALFPALDADIKLTPAGEDATMLTVAGIYRPPLGGLGVASPAEPNTGTPRHRRCRSTSSSSNAKPRLRVVANSSRTFLGEQIVFSL